MVLGVPMWSWVSLGVGAVSPGRPAVLPWGWGLRGVRGGPLRLGAPPHLPGGLLLQSPSATTGRGQYAAEHLGCGVRGLGS